MYACVDVISSLSLQIFSAQIKVFVQGLFDLDQNMGQFKEHLRDFLVQIKVGALNRFYKISLLIISD